MLTPCREIESVLPLFLDGELEAHQMRTVAVHIGGCRGCEEQLRNLEKLQASLAGAIRELTDRTITGSLWPAVEQRLPARRLGLAERIGDWWEDLSPRARLPVLGAAAAGFLIAAALLRQPDPGAVQTAALSPAHESPVRVDAIESTSAIALLRDVDTLALWIDEEGPARTSTPMSEPVSDLASEDLDTEVLSEDLE